jgi:hypothetical protein
VKTANFPMNPAVSGMPANDSMNRQNAPASHGLRRPSPAHWFRCVASPVTRPWESTDRTSVTIAKAPITAAPYASR